MATYLERMDQGAIDSVYGTIEGTFIFANLTDRERAIFRYALALALSGMARCLGVTPPVLPDVLDEIARGLLEQGE